MIKPTKKLENFIDSFETRTDFCKKYDVETSTLSKYLDGKMSCSSKFVSTIIQKTGMDFNKLFYIVEE